MSPSSDRPSNGPEDWEVEEAYCIEEGRILASAREDMILKGADPNQLLIPVHPDDIPRKEK